MTHQFMTIAIDEVAYQAPTEKEIRPVDVVETLANTAEDVTSLVRTHEARQHMATATKYLRWAEAAERQEAN